MWVFSSWKRGPYDGCDHLGDQTGLPLNLPQQPVYGMKEIL